MNVPEYLLRSYRFIGDGKESPLSERCYGIMSALEGSVEASTLPFDEPEEESFTWVGTMDEFQKNFERV